MKKTAIAVAMALAGFATIAQAALEDNAWHTGAKPSQSQYYDTGFINNDDPTCENRLGAGASGGCQVNPYVGFEIGYGWSGRMSHKGSAENGIYKAQGVRLTAKLGYSITGDLNTHTRLGGMVQRAGTKSNVYGKNRDTDVSPAFAGGIEYTITPEIAIRLEHQWTNNIGDAHTIGTRPDNGILSLSVSYRSGQGEAAPVAAPASTPTSEVQAKHFTLKSNIPFNFNKATLKPEGQAILDQLYNQLNNLDPKDGFVIVLGHTDRTDSDAYNQGLPERCARFVVDYPVSKGIPVDRISTRGMGESNPVTGNTCDDVEQCTILIDCLTPDRRVEIEIKGTEDVITQPQA